ncbi:MAG TPA: hypothetical protein VGT78_13195 [Rhizomicrobium sp.]|nr:hypothetical protein [Rhizomicrobium sp.]
MMKKFVRAAFAASLLGSAAGAMVAVSASAVLAADKKPEGPTVSKAVAVPLYEAQKLMEAGDYAGAMAKAKEAQAVPDRTPYDDYNINKFVGYIAINLKDNDTARAAFDAMAESPMLTDADKTATYLNAMVLNGISKNYAKEIEYGTKLEAIKPLDDKSLAMLSQAYYLNNDPNDAGIYAQKSVDAAKAANKDPDPVVLEILMSAQAKANNHAGAVDTLEQIAVANNSPGEWGQLIDVALGTKGIRDLDALYLYRMRFMAGAMKNAEDYTIMARIALQLGYPAEAREVMQQGISAGKVSGVGDAANLLAQSRAAAATDERTLSTIASSAAKSKSGEQDAKLAEDYWGYGRYADAEAAAHSAISKGGMKDSSEGNFILGISLVAQNKNVEAGTPLGKVDGSAAREKAGHLWALFAKARAKQMGQDKPPSSAEAPATPAPAPAQPPAH